MQKAKVILSILKRKSLNREYIFSRLYRNFFNSDFYSYTFQNIHDNLNYLFSGENLKLNRDSINNLIDRFKNQTYLSKSEMDYFINNGISKEYMIVETIVINILEIIYNLRKKTLDYGCQLDEIRREFNNVDYLIVGKYYFEKKSLKKFTRNVLSKNINDNRFLDLIERIIEFKLKIDFNEDRFIRIIEEIIIIDFENSYFNNFIKVIRNKNNFMIGYKGKHKDFINLVEEVNLCKYVYLNCSIKNFNFEKVEFMNFEIKKITKYKNKEYIDITIPTKVINNLINGYTKNKKIIHYGKRINYSVDKIVTYFINDYRNVYEYYKNTDLFRKKIKKYKFYNYKALLKTISRKEKSTVNKTLKKYKDFIDCEYSKIENVNK